MIADRYGLELSTSSRAAADAYGEAVDRILLHCAVAFAGAGDVEALDRRLAELRQMEGAGRQPAGSVVAALVEAIGAFARGDWGRTVTLIEPATDQIERVGGSRAQRDLVEDTLLEAYVRAGRAEAATSLLRQRLERRPCPSDTARLAALAG